MENPEKIVKECDEVMAKIHECRARLDAEKTSIGRELEGLKRGASALLASIELGEATAKEATQLKNRIAEGEERLSDIDLALVGLQNRDEEVDRQSAKASHEILRVRGLEEYEAIKEKVRAFESADQLGMHMKIAIMDAAGKAFLNEAGNEFIEEQERRLKESDRRRFLGN